MIQGMKRSLILQISALFDIILQISALFDIILKLLPLLLQKFLDRIPKEYK